MSDADPGFTEERSVRESQPENMTAEEWKELERLCHKVLEDITVASHEVIGEAIRTTGAFAAAVQAHEARRD